MIAFRERAVLGAAFSVLLLGSTLAAALTLAPNAKAAPAMTVVATGLDAPKQPAIGPDGAIYVASSGHAGPTDTALEGSPYNHSGAVVRVTPDGTVTPFLTGLLSRFDEGSSIGPSGIAWWRGSFYVAQGLDDVMNTPAGQLLSSPVLKIAPDGRVRTFTSFNAVNLDPNNPGLGLDTNPYGMAVGDDGNLYVTDGGDNAVWQVRPDGTTALFAQFPNDPTVTGLAVTPHLFHDVFPRFRFNERAPSLVVCLFGNGMSGFANGSVVTVGIGGVHTLVPTGTITMPIGAVYSPSGQLYILQFATPSTAPGPPFAFGTGAIWAVSPSGTATKVLSGLNFPTGMVFGRDGTLWVTNNGIFPASGASSEAPTGSLVKVTGLS